MLVIWLVEDKRHILLLWYCSTAFLYFGVAMFIYVQGMDVKCVHKCSQETHVKRACSHQL